MTQPEAEPDFDVIVIGAGVAGCSVAQLLAAGVTVLPCWSEVKLSAGRTSLVGFSTRG